MASPSREQERRSKMREKLLDFYHLDPNAAGGSVGGGARRPTAAAGGSPSAAGNGPAELDFDSASFDVQKYTTSLLQRESLRGLVEADTNLLRRIRALDGELQDLVYKNYSKFIAATDTIRQMRDNVAQMGEKLTAVSENVAQIDQLSQSLTGQLGEHRQKIEDMTDANRQLRKVQFLIELPDALESFMRAKKYHLAVKFWVAGDNVFLKYQDVVSFKKTHVGCAQTAMKLYKELETTLFETSKQSFGMYSAAASMSAAAASAGGGANNASGANQRMLRPHDVIDRQLVILEDLKLLRQTSLKEALRDPNNRNNDNNSNNGSGEGAAEFYRKVYLQMIQFTQNSFTDHFEKVKKTIQEVFARASGQLFSRTAAAFGVAVSNNSNTKETTPAAATATTALLEELYQEIKGVAPALKEQLLHMLRGCDALFRCVTDVFKLVPASVTATDANQHLDEEHHIAQEVASIAQPVLLSTLQMLEKSLSSFGEHLMASCLTVIWRLSSRFGAVEDPATLVAIKPLLLTVKDHGLGIAAHTLIQLGQLAAQNLKTISVEYLRSRTRMSDVFNSMVDETMASVLSSLHDCLQREVLERDGALFPTLGTWSKVCATTGLPPSATQQNAAAHADALVYLCTSLIARSFWTEGINELFVPTPISSYADDDEQMTSSPSSSSSAALMDSAVTVVDTAVLRTALHDLSKQCAQQYISCFGNLVVRRWGKVYLAAAPVDAVGATREVRGAVNAWRLATFVLSEWLPAMDHRAGSMAGVMSSASNRESIHNRVGSSGSSYLLPHPGGNSTAGGTAAEHTKRFPLVANFQRRDTQMLEADVDRALQKGRNAQLSKTGVGGVTSFDAASMTELVILYTLRGVIEMVRMAPKLFTFHVAQVDGAALLWVLSDASLSPAGATTTASSSATKLDRQGSTATGSNNSNNSNHNGGGGVWLRNESAAVQSIHEFVTCVCERSVDNTPLPPAVVERLAKLDATAQ